MSPNDIGSEVVWTVIVAAGGGSRFGGAKQYELVGDRRVLDRSIDVARSISDGVVVVVPAGDARREQAVAGGSTRAESVRAGLAQVPEAATIVCVHDAARPFATTALFAAVVEAVHLGADGAVPGLAVTDTVKVVSPDGSVLSTLDRSMLVAVQTPQAFRAEALRAAHATGADGTDDAALVEADGGRVVVVDGDSSNRKITVPADLDWARAHVAALARGATA